MDDFDWREFICEPKNSFSDRFPYPAARKKDFKGYFLSLVSDSLHSQPSVDRSNPYPTKAPMDHSPHINLLLLIDKDLDNVFFHSLGSPSYAVDRLQFDDMARNVPDQIGQRFHNRIQTLSSRINCRDCFCMLLSAAIPDVIMSSQLFLAYPPSENNNTNLPSSFSPLDRKQAIRHDRKC